ncbi:MAG: hypothetical protein ACKVU0_18235 [Saprospiraceae bacterium]
MDALLLTGPKEDLKTLIPLFKRLGLSFSFLEDKATKEKSDKVKTSKKASPKKIILTRHLDRIMQEDDELLQKLA